MTTSDKPKQEKIRYGKVDFVVDLLVRGIFGVIRWLPYHKSVPVAGWLARVVLARASGMNRRIGDNLRHVKPDISAQEIKMIRTQVWDSFGRLTLESISVNGFLRHAEKAEMAGPGLAAMMQAISEKRPVILLSGHFGNYQVIRVLLRKLGHDTAGVYRPLNNGYTNRHYVNNMNKVAQPNFSRGSRGTKRLLRVIRSGGIAAMLIDQQANEGEVLTFMGKPARTLVSAAQMALKYDALLVPCFSIRQPNGLDFKVVVEAPIPHSTPTEMIQRFNDVLETRIWLNPGQWFWIHRRWKRVY